MDRGRRRVTSAVARFFKDGWGPTHATLDRSFQEVGLEVDQLGNNKQERVLRAFRIVDATDFWHLADLVIESLDLLGMDDDLPDVQRLTVALAQSGRRLDAAGFLEHDNMVLADQPLIDEHADLEPHLARVRRALRDGDPEQAIGSSKDLIEATTKHVIAEVSGESLKDLDMPALVKRAQEVLGLHAKDVASEAPAADLTRQVLGSLQQIALAVMNYRNQFGSGHGRIGQIRLTPRHGRLVAGAAAVYCSLLLETLQDPEAPWRSG